jgi:hypothetical protein
LDRATDKPILKAELFIHFCFGGPEVNYLSLILVVNHVQT